MDVPRLARAPRPTYLEMHLTMTQTLLDPFELAFPPPASARTAAPLAPPSPPLEAQAERESALPPSPDSSGRLRYWCSED